MVLHCFFHFNNIKIYHLTKALFCCALRLIRTKSIKHELAYIYGIKLVNITIKE